MGTNHHTTYSGTAFTAAGMGAPLSELDRAITYESKKIMMSCDGTVTFAAGTLTWTGSIHIYFNSAAGLAIHNSIAAGSIALSDSEFAYVTLNETNDTVLTVSKAAITTAAASNYLAYNRLILGYRNASNDQFFSDGLPVINSPSNEAITGTSSTIMPTTANTGGGYKTMYSEATATLSGASTSIEVNVPSGAEIIGTQLRTDTAITSGDGATSFSAAFAGGMTDSICSAQPFTKNNKVTSRTSGLVASETDITITPNSGTFSGGVVRAVVYYSIFNALSDNP
jgi:hypothetical protein